MITSHQKEIAQKAMDIALKNKCQAARVTIMTGINNSFEYRNTQLDNLHQSAENKLYVEIYVNGRYGSFSTNRIEKNDLETFIRNGVDSTLFLAKDTAQQLPHCDRCYKGSNDSLDLCDPSYNSLATRDKINMCQQVVDEVRDTDKRIISASSTYADGIGAEYMVASNGLEVETLETSFNITAEVSLKTDTHARAESYWYDSAIYWHDMQTKEIGRIALERALRKIGQKKIKSGKYLMLLDNTTSSRLLSPLLGAMSGAALQQKSSFLIDKLGKTIACDKLSISDTPHIARAFGARYYDGEGVATTNRMIIDKGVLKTYFISTYYSNKMKIEPTISSASIITTQHGDSNHEQMMHALSKGIWVTGFNGGNNNPTTGDFSFGVEGFLIENGMITTPIGEMNITGNILDLWSKLEKVGNDPRTNSHYRIPSLLFNEVNFSGI